MYEITDGRAWDRMGSNSCEIVAAGWKLLEAAVVDCHNRGAMGYCSTYGWNTPTYVISMTK